MIKMHCIIYENLKIQKHTHKKKENGEDMIWILYLFSTYFSMTLVNSEIQPQRNTVKCTIVIYFVNWKRLNSYKLQILQLTPLKTLPTV